MGIVEAFGLSALGTAISIGVLALMRWWVWRRRWMAVFQQAVNDAFPSPWVRIARLTTWERQKWSRVRVEAELEKLTPHRFPRM